MINLGCSYYDNKNPRHFKRDMAHLARHGLHHLVLCFSENDHRYYADNFRLLISIAHDHQLEVWLDPWGWGGIFGGEAFTYFGGWEKTAQQQVYNKGQMESVPLLCFNNPRTDALMQDWLQTGARVGADGIFWDEPHFFMPVLFGYPRDSWGCGCPYCQDNWGITPTLGPSERIKRQQASMLDFIRRNSKIAADLGLQNSLCLLPEYATGAMEQAVAPYLALPHLQALGTDPYWSLFKKTPQQGLAMAAQVHHQVRAGGKKSWFWLQGFKMPLEHMDGWQIEADGLRELAPDYLSLWSFRATESLTRLASGNSGDLWHRFIKLLD